MRVATWNLWWRFGDWRRRERAIATVLEREDPDVVCLQEVWATRTVNQAESLAARRGLHVAWAPSPRPDMWQRRLGDTSVTIGNAVLSRWPLLEQGQVHLTAGGAPDEGRTLLHVRVAAPDGPLPVLTTQLTSAAHHSAVRVAQVRQIADVVAERRLPGRPAVLAGDFNAVPDSDEIRLLEGFRTAPPVPGLVLVDAWRYADPTDPGTTWDHRRNPYVHASLEPSGRIDYVFVTLPGPDGAGSVADVRVVGDGPEHGTWPSDHAAVVADLRPGP